MLTWMLYGATGYTGVLLAEEAVRRGHKPLLAGRSADKLKPLAERLGLDYLAVGLEDHEVLVRALDGVDLVLHVAGPFSRTGKPMARACLTAGVHYLDLTGEISVFEMIYGYNKQAKKKGIALISGVGFDVIPTDCLAKYVADQIADAKRLNIAMHAITTTSPGTTKTQLEIVAGGGLARRDGWLVPYSLGSGARWVRFSHGKKPVMAAPLADLSSAYRATGVPNITAYIVLPPGLGVIASRAPAVLPAVQSLFASAWVRRAFGWLIERTVKGPSAEHRQQARSYIWAGASNAQGETAQAWLETIEAYQFTAVAGIRSVERVLAGGLRGALSPAQAFGADFVLEIEGTRRYDNL